MATLLHLTYVLGRTMGSPPSSSLLSSATISMKSLSLATHRPAMLVKRQYARDMRYFM